MSADAAREAQVRGDLAWERKLRQQRDNRIAALEADLRAERGACEALALTARAATERLQVAEALLRVIQTRLAPRRPIAAQIRASIVDAVDEYLRARSG